MIFFTFIPWFLFWMILGLHQSEPAALAGGISALIVAGITLARGQKLKLLQAGTLIYFIGLSIFVFLTDLENFGPWVRISSSLFLALIVLLSILVKKPFTLQYARERVTPEVWNSAEFIQTNYVISWVWFMVLLCGVIIPTSKLFGFHPPKILGPAFSIITILAAMKFSNWYYRRKHR